MSFDNSQMTLIHLVSFPSTWLPPPNTLKALVVGLDQKQLEGLVENCQNNFADYSFAFYYVPKLDLTSTEIVDWLLINQTHMHGSFFQVSSQETLCLALSSKGKTSANLERANEIAQKLAEHANLHTTSLDAFVIELTTNSRKV